MAEAHSQLCLVVPSLWGVDCMKLEGNMTDWCLCVCHQSNRGLHTITRVITYPVLSSLFWAVPHPLWNSRKNRKDVISDWAIFGGFQETDFHFNHRISAWQVMGCSTLCHVWDHTACDRWECWYQCNSKKLHFILRIHVIIKIFVIGGSHSSNYEDTISWHVTPNGLCYNLRIDGGSRILQNMSKFLPDYKSYLRMLICII